MKLRNLMLTIAASCGLLVALAVPSVRAAPEFESHARLGAMLTTGMAPWERSLPETTERGGDYAARAEAAAVETSAATSGAEAPTADAVDAAVGHTPRGRFPLEGPAAPTPFGLSLVGLLGVGFWMHRRQRRMASPLI